ncbi:tyrosine-type recombinase/integrase [Clostridium botulinum]|uniref:tyrosine-type recombinase/integrase n=1 Tax=Clostridium botulinum TaxID=1491 RepID=UPI00325FDD22
MFLTPAVKKAINDWLQIRNSINTNALFISRNKCRITTKSIQNIVKKYVIASGLDPKFISTHKLRHQQLLLCINTAKYIFALFNKYLVKVLLQLKSIPILMSINYSLQ